ncbi:MFS transporter [Actinomadura barringtoniae]|uniref:MFS transporter n=1 Tax=Actinomadura barringtoniae TaxID=1427535 RepID=A0A939PPH5_9ACTN|nr:MFS transporter [Actinomadura barringtoniae]MBO2452824.1 MFS transporter [Actinomadura barringtoniae]
MAIMAPARGSLTLGVLAASQVVLLLDVTLVNVALPSIQRELHTSAAELSWVVNAYTLVFSGLLLLGGRAGDILGHRRVFTAGAALFTVASLLGGLAFNAELLLVARAAMGAGAALTGPGSLALIATGFPDGRARNRAYAVITSAGSVGMMLGMVVGGALIEWGTWRWTFFINVPIGAAVVVLSRSCLHESPRLRGRFDVAGALTATAGVTLLVYGVVRAAESGWEDELVVASLAVAAVLLALFVAVEARAPQPIMSLGLLRDRRRAGACVMRLLLTAAMSGMIFFLTLYVQQVLGFGPLETGLAFLPTTLTVIAANRAVPWLLQRAGPKPVMVGGSVLAVIGMVWLTQISATSTYVSMILGPVLLFGAGHGLVSVAATAMAMADLPAGEHGGASGLIQTMQVGGPLGIAVLVAVYEQVGGTRVQALAGAFTGALVLSLLMLGTALTVFGTRRRPCT